jgi:thiol-disulfide isomerase/thioredoxin
LEFPVRLILLLLATLAIAGCDTQKAEQQQGAPEAEAAAGKGIDRSHHGQSAPMVDIFDADNDRTTLSTLEGKPFLVNLWASWCAPCVKELPTLEALSKRTGAPQVIAVSQDMAPRSSVDAFLLKHRLDTLEVWHDPNMALSGALGAQILPTTILYGADGKEVWRYTGDLDWAGPQAAKLLAEASRAATR